MPVFVSKHWRGAADIVGRLFVVLATVFGARWFLDRPPANYPEPSRPVTTSAPATIVPVTIPVVVDSTPEQLPTAAPVATAVIAVPTGVPAAPQVAAPQVAAPQPVTPTPVVELVASPAQRVALFYRLLDQSNFEGMATLVSPAYKQQSPTISLLKDRLDPGHMQVRRNETFMQTDEIAGVLVDVYETVNLPKPYVNRYVGVWWLVTSPTGWLLDKPDLELEGNV